MLKPSKWIKQVTAEMPVRRAAKIALRVRLQSVLDFLPRAAYHPEEDIEHVHQLRVSTRRSVAALDIFRPLTGKNAKRLRKQLKEIRRSAGMARDFDVLFERWKKLAGETPDPAWQGLLARLQVERERAQPPLVAVARKMERKRLSHLVSQVVHKLDENAEQAEEEPHFVDFARQRLSEDACRFFAASPSAEASDEALHQFRIEGKKLRYAMELFAAAFGREFRKDIYPQIEQLQEVLGEHNDHATAQIQLMEWIRNTSDTTQRIRLEQLFSQEKENLKESRARFEAWWTPEKLRELRRLFESLDIATSRLEDQSFVAYVDSSADQSIYQISTDGQLPDADKPLAALWRHTGSPQDAVRAKSVVIRSPRPMSQHHVQLGAAAQENGKGDASAKRPSPPPAGAKQPPAEPPAPQAPPEPVPPAAEQHSQAESSTSPVHNEPASAQDASETSAANQAPRQDDGPADASNDG